MVLTEPNSKQNRYNKRLHRTLSKYGKLRDDKNGPSRSKNIPSSHFNTTPTSASSESKKSLRQTRSVERLNLSDIPLTSIEHPQNNLSDVNIYSKLLPERTSYQNGLKLRSDSLSPHPTDQNQRNDFFDSTDKMQKIDFFDETLDQQLAENETIDYPPYFFEKVYHQGTIWKMFCLKYLKDKSLDEPWPIFTYWLMSIEIVIMIYILAQYGFKLDSEDSKYVWHQSNSYQMVKFYEHPNYWIGPRFANLIDEGGKFTPCIRKVKTILKTIDMRKSLENKSGCCIRNDFSCVQSLASHCSNKTSFFVKWNDKPGPVCGQDPKYCSDKKDFSQNITDWPTCTRINYDALSTSKDLHMKCIVSAHPCSVGIYGKCILASKEHCEALKGKYHPEALLCSQIDPMEDVCGKFLYPYQLYRLLLSLFIHAGLIQIIINLYAQYFYLRHLEQVLGIWRVMVLYFISGIGGNLVSSVLLPITPDVGSNPAMVGSISFLIFEMIRQGIYENPIFVFMKIFILLIFLVLPGLILPFLDIFSTVSGLILGFILTFLIHPFLEMKKNVERWVRIVAFSILLIIFMFFITLLFTGSDLTEQQKWLNKLNCIPLPFLNCSDIDIAYDEIKTLN